jgi:hypothetical protein
VQALPLEEISSTASSRESVLVMRLEPWTGQGRALWVIASFYDKFGFFIYQQHEFLLLMTISEWAGKS